MIVLVVVVWLVWAILYDDNQRAERRRLEQCRKSTLPNKSGKPLKTWTS